jgi:hypothetical protein
MPRLSLWLDKDLAAILRATAEAQKRSISSFCGLILKDYATDHLKLEQRKAAGKAQIVVLPADLSMAAKLRRDKAWQKRAHEWQQEKLATGWSRERVSMELRARYAEFMAGLRELPDMPEGLITPQRK